jgi:hypothetical protein
MPITTWVDQSGPTPGTSLAASNLNAMTAADTTEAATNDTLGGSSTYVNNLNRIRYQLGQLVGGAWTAAVAMIPLAQKAAANGVASLNASSKVVQDPASRGAANGVASLDGSTKVPIAQLPLNGSPSSPPAVVAVDSSNVADLSGSGTAATASAGINGATPSQVAGYLTLYVTHNSVRTLVKVPYYLP